MTLLLNRNVFAEKKARISSRQRGSSLLVSLLMLIVVLLLGVAAMRMALQGEKASRSDRDRQIAFQAAEAGLMDAEMDIEGSPSGTLTRSSMFSERPVVEDFVVGCGAGLSNKSLGLCQPASGNDKPVWETVNFDDSGSNARTVPFGTFTGQVMQVGGGMQPSKLPRYIIEVIKYKAAGEDATIESTYFYRITAVGFGVRPSTQVALQTFYRKVDK